MFSNTSKAQYFFSNDVRASYYKLSFYSLSFCSALCQIRLRSFQKETFECVVERTEKQRKKYFGRISRTKRREHSNEYTLCNIIYE